MTKIYASMSGNASLGNVVARPRRTDGVGKALRSAFRDDSGVPGDMRRMLALLDRFDGGR